MIERRYPIQTVLAERKMFAGGGAVLPQQMMPPQQSGGILASSGPLLDAVAAGAVNPDGDGGASLSDVQGFRVGGSIITPQGIPVNLNAEDAEAADAARGAMVDFGPVPEATIPESSITAYEPEAANPGFIESIRNVLGTSGRSSVAGDGSVLKLLGDSLQSEQVMNENDQGEIIRSSIAGDGSVLKAIGDLGGDLYDYDSRLPTPSARTAYDIKRALVQARDVADRKFMGGPGSSPDNVINPAPTNTVGEFETLPERVGLTPEEAKELNLQGMPTEDLYGFADPETGSAEAGTPVSAEAAIREAEVEGELVGGSQIKAQSDADSSENVVENVATIFGNIFSDDETPKSPDKTKSAMAKAVEDFKSAMPEYEGMSESEKGYAIMEAGLRIMAGKSPDALTNIAEGLKGLGPKFAKDAKDKRAWNRQIDLSAAKYGLETVAKDKAIEQADERKLFFFYDQSPGKVTKSTPYGEQVAISRKQLLDRGGKLPPNLVKADLVSKSVVGLSASAKSFKKNILANIKAYNITEAESAKIKVELDKTLKTFRQSEAGINLLGMAKARIAKMNTSDGSSIGSFGAAFKDQLNNLANISGADWGKRFKKGKYTNMKLAKADVNMALQALIKADLGSTQAANSISDKDVKLLADAYVDSGFQKNSNSWDLLGLDTKVLGRKLDGALGVFRSNQKAALGVYDGILERFDTVEGKYATVPEMWRMEVDQGPYRRSSFETRLKNVSPYAQALRGRGEGSGGVVSNTGKILRTIVTPTGDFTLNDKNKFVFKPKQGQ